MRKFSLLTAALLAAVSIGGGNAANAQGLFDPVVTVNTRAITKYEVNQRVRFLTLLRQPGASASAAREALIEEQLKMAAAQRRGIRLTDEALAAEMEAFAARTGNNLAKFTAELNRNGIDQATLRDFVEAGITWREVVRGRFGARSAPSEAEIDRAAAASGPRGGLRVLMSEIILIARPDVPGEAEEAKRLAEQFTRITSTGVFSARARDFSVSQSKDSGGHLPWSNLNELPPPLRPIIAAMKPGDVSAPLEVPNAIILFQLRAVEETNVRPRSVNAMEYARVTGPTEAVQTALQHADVCDDFYGLVKRNPELSLEIVSETPKNIDRAMALRLATLDPNEISLLPQTNGNSDLLMLCARVFDLGSETSREDIAANLRTQRITTLAEGYLAELRASATITFH
ncbi:MAG: peptidylprolyl isomerase [Planktomarina sp.]